MRFALALVIFLAILLGVAILFVRYNQPQNYDPDAGLAIINGRSA